MIKLSHIATALLLTSISVAHAETTNQPVTQGAASVNQNLSTDTDNGGLQNAAARLKANEEKVVDKRADADKKSDEAKHKHKKEEAHEKHEEHADHDRMARVDHEKVERPAKPERPAR